MRRALFPLVGDAEISALRRYQALDRTYELVNEVLRAERHPDELSNDELVAVRALVREFDVLLARWRTPEPVRVYRGLRSRVGFDVDESPAVSRSFLSTTVFRDIAIREFTVPPGPGGTALLEIDVPAGTPGVWVPPLGDRALAYQGELLLGREVRLAVRDSDVEAGILVVDCYDTGVGRRPPTGALAARRCPRRNSCSRRRWRARQWRHRRPTLDPRMRGRWSPR